ncbi:hypothetical protein [Paenibacillus sp. OV219]|uniref:beta strand repeat-containing protein n=1 Tax=Paenibacillus sp. OV219 TaxID=1884377 RepID=UPI0008BC9BAA|nr:hypothetical protein [Paenibacillus sp. OV219]SEO30647.1 hypothetical protein SAMN05518847_10745 [Paenibacillus sp. OV219]
MKLKARSKVQPQAKGKTSKLAAGLLSATLLLAAISPTAAIAATATDITIVNNKAGISDTITVANVNQGDIVKVYTASTGGTLLGSATAEDSSVTVEVAQLGAAAGNAYIQVNTGTRITKAYTAETSAALAATAITSVINNTTGSDSVKVSGLKAGDKVTVYGALVASATASSDGDVTVTADDLLLAAGGSFQITVTRLNKLESAKITKTYSKSSLTNAPGADSITVNNNYLVNDSVKVTGLSTGATVKVYKAATGGTAIATDTETSGEVTLDLGTTTLAAAAGNLYVSVTEAGKDESGRTVKAYTAEQSLPLAAANIVTLTNGATGKDDSVQVEGLAVGDTIKVYKTSAATDTTVLMTDTITSGTTAIAKAVDAFAIGTGSVYVSVERVGKKESTRVAKAYTAQKPSAALTVSQITVNNNKGQDDTVVVTGLTTGAKVYVYKAATGVAINPSGEQESSGTATINLGTTNLLAGTGSIYLSVENPDELLSTRVAKPYTSETSVTAPVANITIANNKTGVDDTVKVVSTSAYSLAEGDIVAVYDAATAGNKLGEATVDTGDTEVTVSLSGSNALKIAGGSVYISVTKVDKGESARVAKTYTAQASSTALIASQVTVSNNYNTADTVVATGLTPGDVINVYKLATGGTAIGTATVATGKTDATASLSEDLGTVTGYVYVSVNKDGGLESARLKVAFGTDGSTALLASAITVTNNYTGNQDEVSVTGLTEGDVITLYAAASGGTALATSSAVATAETTASIEQTDLLTVAGGSVFVSVTKKDKKESTRTKQTYIAEPKSVALNAADVTVTNNAATGTDSVKVIGLNAGDTIRVYGASTGGSVLGSGTPTNGTAQFTLPDLTAAGSMVYVSIQRSQEQESNRVAVAYQSQISNAPTTATISVSNSYGTALDTVTVSSLEVGDIVKVYADNVSATTAEATATVASGSSVVVDMSAATPGLSDTANGTVYVTVTKPNKSESATRTSAAYNKAPQSTAPTASNIAVVNNGETNNDIVNITNGTVGDIFKVYSASTGGSAIGTGTYAGGTLAIDIGAATLTAGAGGSVYVTVQNANKTESTRTAKTYIAETQSAALDLSDITVVNNTGTGTDAVTVDGLNPGDIVYVYPGTSGGTGTAGTPTSGKATVPFVLTDAGGTVRVSVKRSMELESTLIPVTYSSQVSKAPIASSITVTNGFGSAVGADTVTVTNLAVGDVVKIYADNSTSSVGATGTVTSGSAVAIDLNGSAITLSDIASGSVYVTVTKPNKDESTPRVAAAYIKAPQSSAPAAGDIAVVNNGETNNDFVNITNNSGNISDGDVFNVYSASSGGSAIATGTYAGGTLAIDIGTANLTAGAGGSVYVTVQTTNKTESARTAQTYNAETQSTALDLSDITVVNNSGIGSDTVTVDGLNPGDIVYVYSAATGGTGTSGTPTSGKASVTFALTDAGGSVYVSVKRTMERESTRATVSYQSQVTKAPAVASISNANGVGTGAGVDTVTVANLVVGDVVKIYADNSTSTVGATGTVSAGTSVTIDLNATSITLSNTTAGTIYVTVTKASKDESTRTAYTYTTAPPSATPTAGDFTVKNNGGSNNDVVTVTNNSTNIAATDVFRVYSAATGGTLLGTSVGDASVLATPLDIDLGSASALVAAGGKVYITVQSAGKIEGPRVAVTYTDENSVAPTLAQIAVLNDTGSTDIVRVSGMVSGDKVTVYAADGTTVLGTVSWTSGTSIKVTGLNLAAGSTIKVSVTNGTKAESTKVTVSYNVE